MKQPTPNTQLTSPAMKPPPPPPSPPRRYLPPLIAAVLLTSLLISSSLLLSPASPLSAPPATLPRFVESKLSAPPSPPSAVPRLAYLISGSVSDLLPIQRALRALYHPANRYLLHLDRASSPADRFALAASLTTDPVYSHFNNVNLVSRANLITYRGPTMVSNTLHAAAVLLRDGDWDWFINLSASDYPLVTQDDLMYALAGVPRGLNFLEHTSDIGWKESQRARPVIIDPGFYSSQKSEVFWVTEKRSVPTAFKLFTGSAWMMLSHQFIDFCIWGWDNLPRTVLMYYANFLSSPEGYFHTVICNAPEFLNTTVNHDLHYIYWDNPPKQHPHFLTLEDFARMVDSNAPFARKFGRDDPVLAKIDKELLGRAAGGFVPGGWFDGFVKNTSDPNYFVGDVSELRPGAGADRLKRLITGLLTAKDFDEKHCI